MNREVFLENPQEIGQRGLSKILIFLSQSDYPPGLDKLERLYQSLEQAYFKGATLHGVQVSRMPSGDFLLCREPREASEVLPLSPGEFGLWDKRFRVEFTGKVSGLEVRALGEKGWENIAQQNPEVKEFDLPHAGRASLPAFYKEGEVVCVPHINVSQENLEGRAEFSPKNKIFPENQ